MLWYRPGSLLIIFESQLKYDNIVYYYENNAVVGSGISPNM